MTQAPVRVIATFAVQADKLDEFIEAARRTLVAPTRKEAGCVQYDLCQDAADPTRFALVEAWESEGALEAHLAQPSLQAAVTRLAPLAAEAPRVQRLRAVS